MSAKPEFLLTKKMIQILAMVRWWWGQWAESPSLQDLADRLECTKQNVFYYVKLLSREGYLEVGPAGRGRVRKISLTTKSKDLLAGKARVEIRGKGDTW